MEADISKAIDGVIFRSKLLILWNETTIEIDESELKFDVSIQRNANIFELAPVVTKLFQLSIDTGTFPYDLKNAGVPTIPKKIFIMQISKYRPIAVVSALRNFLEKIIISEILRYLEKH